MPPDTAVASAPLQKLPAQPLALPMRINAAQSGHLDLLRGVAAQMVLVQHALGLCFPDRGYEDYGLGALGVQVFFLLSGFLITHSIVSRARTGSYSLTDFLVSRFARIYTPYIPAILLVALLDWFSSRAPGYPYGADYNLGTGIANLAMLQDFPLFQILRRLHVPEQDWFVKSFGSGRQFWTVSIEWWIYVTVGVAAFLALRRKAGVWLFAVLALACIEPLYNFVGGPGDSLTFTWMLGGLACLALARIEAAAWAGGLRGFRVFAFWCGVAGLAALTELTIAMAPAATTLYLRVSGH
jgi:peptidoglycan/LPS O-acetylase OafA/YrhL